MWTSGGGQTVDIRGCGKMGPSHNKDKQETGRSGLGVRCLPEEPPPRSLLLSFSLLTRITAYDLSCEEAL